MKTKLKMVYWKGDKFWVGKLVDHPEIMTQGATIEELEENMADAYRLMAHSEDTDITDRKPSRARQQAVVTGGIWATPAP